VIARTTGIPYIADYRDPWAIGVPELDGYDSPVSRLLGQWLERRTQAAAHTVIHNNVVALERALAQPTLPHKPRVCIANGYDGEPTRQGPDPATFRILFSGWIHAFMDPRVLLRAIESLRAEDPRGTAALRLEFIGAPSVIDDVPIEDVVRAYGLADCTTFAARVTREEAMRAQEQAAVLVAFDCPHPLAVAMKFYDYLLMRGDLLLIAEPSSALDRSAQQVGWRTIAPGDHEGLVAALRRALARWRAGNYPDTHDPGRLMHRGRRSAEVLALLETTCEPGAQVATQQIPAGVGH
jgi:glycosyltransferase involved in cell wall biosynthesis